MAGEFPTNSYIV